MTRKLTPLKSILKEEFYPTQGNGSGGAGDFLFQGEVKEVLAQLFLGDEIGGLAEVFGQGPHGADIAALSFGRETMQLHVLEESSTQR